MNKQLYSEVSKVLNIIGELPYSDMRRILETSLEIIGKYSYLDICEFEGDIAELDIEEEQRD